MTDSRTPSDLVTEAIADQHDELWQVLLENVTAGLVVRYGRVRHAAPVCRWMIGKELDDVRRWVEWHGGRVQRAEPRKMRASAIRPPWNGTTPRKSGAGLLSDAAKMKRGES